MFKKIVSVILCLALCAGGGLVGCKQTNGGEGLKAQAVFTPLPLGSISADGWLLHQLQLQKENITGDAEALYPELGENSYWLGGDEPGSKYDAAPYYVRGLIVLAYTLDDAALKAKAQKWVEYILTSQREDGSFGPYTTYDWWSRMLVVYALCDYCEATQDERVVPFLEKYFAFMADNIEFTPLEDWGRQRIGDLIEGILWLYRRNGDDSLFDLIAVIESQADDLITMYSSGGFFDFEDAYYESHAVNVNQTMKYAPLAWLMTGEEYAKKTYWMASEYLDRYHGQPSGMPSGTETLAGTSASQGVELCSVVERMQSNEKAQMILGEAWIGDQLEQITFNAFAASVDAEMKLHQYYHAPNQVQSLYDVSLMMPYRANHSNDLLLSPVSGWPCCRFNVHNGWTSYIKSMWARSEEGIAALAYGPSTVKTEIDGKSVTVREETNYPFEESLRFTFETEKRMQFPFTFRIPAWADGASVRVNGELQPAVRSGEYYTVERKWETGDTVELQVPMSPRLESESNGSVSVHYGPLAFSLDLNEKRVEHEIVPLTMEGTEMTVHNPSDKYREYELIPQNDWNYALQLDRADAASCIRVVRGEMPENPFIAETTPVRLLVQGRQLHSWGISADNILPQEPPAGAAESDAPLQTLELVPYGAQNIRLTCFPVLGTGEEGAPNVYYAADAVLGGGAKVKTSPFASTGKYVGDINSVSDYIDFTDIVVDRDGAYDIDIWFANANITQAVQNFVFNDGSPIRVEYPCSSDWGDFLCRTITVNLKAGTNTLRIYAAKNFAEIDCIRVRESSPYEAERAYRSGASVGSAASASEGLFAMPVREGDGCLEFTVRVAADDVYSLSFVYANGGAQAASLRMSVNGEADTEQTFASTGAWNAFGQCTAQVSLRAGLNTLRLEKANGYVQIDCLKFI